MTAAGSVKVRKGDALSAGGDAARVPGNAKLQLKRMDAQV